MAEHDRNDVPGYEPRDAPARLPFWVIVFMVVFVPLGLLIVWALMSTLWPMAAEPESLFEEPRRGIQGPRLQENLARDYAAFRRDIERHLHTVGWANRDAGIVHLPIEQAKQLLLERGLSGPEASSQGESSAQGQGSADSQNASQSQQQESTAEPEEPP
ncbi:hypothetical protein [Litchfieldella rifensis]|uniref:Uncharacterized protein n=1 Tax=Litchfieldella rifensis TaxID=762643 RepID=A0ABV7LMX8_9GAMM